MGGRRRHSPKVGGQHLPARRPRLAPAGQDRQEHLPAQEVAARQSEARSRHFQVSINCLFLSRSYELCYIDTNLNFRIKYVVVDDVELLLHSIRVKKIVTFQTSSAS